MNEIGRSIVDKVHRLKKAVKIIEDDIAGAPEYIEIAAWKVEVQELPDEVIAGHSILTFYICGSNGKWHFIDDDIMKTLAVTAIGIVAGLKHIPGVDSAIFWANDTLTGHKTITRDKLDEKINLFNTIGFWGGIVTGTIPVILTRLAGIIPNYNLRDIIFFIETTMKNLLKIPNDAITAISPLNLISARYSELSYIHHMTHYLFEEYYPSKTFGATVKKFGIYAKIVQHLVNRRVAGLDLDRLRSEGWSLEGLMVKDTQNNSDYKDYFKKINISPGEIAKAIEFLDPTPKQSWHDGSMIDLALNHYGTVRVSGESQVGRSSHRVIPYNMEFTGLIIEEGIKVIGAWAFSNCASLTSIMISSTVERIETNAFENCRSLKEISVQGFEAPKIRSTSLDTFKGVNRKNIDLYVPKGNKNEYLKKGWTGFKNIIELED